MPKLTWKDESGYSHGQRGKVEPSVLTCEADYLTVTVHRLHGLQGWFLNCRALDMVDRALDSPELKFAQDQAVRMVIKNAHARANTLVKDARFLSAALLEELNCERKAGCVCDDCLTRAGR